MSEPAILMSLPVLRPPVLMMLVPTLPVTLPYQIMLAFWLNSVPPSLMMMPALLRATVE